MTRQFNFRLEVCGRVVNSSIVDEEDIVKQVYKVES